ncbi:MAG: SDR family NAD(P)-dependent oxidoreductase, partial [Deltaproteobacteria bacterium]
MSYDGRHLVVTGGTGALGRAVVARLVADGATCHVPARSAEEAAGFALAGHERVHVADGVDLTDEAAVEAYYGALPTLWGSIHVVGGFSMAPLLETGAAELR